jgi:hypothetical protein
MCENRFEQQVLLQSHVLLTFKVVRHYFKKAVTTQKIDLLETTEF